VVFSAGFHGRQDAYWVAAAGLTATCVDIRPADAMAAVYPADWEFVQADAYDYADEQVLRGRGFDIVSLDPPTGQFTRCGENLYLWCALARSVVVLGVGVDTALSLPAGWTLTDIRFRSGFRGGVYWAVLERQ
jgi:hypothetical protein